MAETLLLKTTLKLTVSVEEGARGFDGGERRKGRCKLGNMVQKEVHLEG